MIGRDVGRVILISEPALGLRALIVIDDTRLGPAVGGTRLRHYPSFDEALADAALLARAMTLKCALAGLDAGGGKAVVFDSPELNRSAAFTHLGAVIEDLRGAFWTSGDLGTSRADLAAMGASCQYVAQDAPALAGAVAMGVMQAMEACARHCGREGVNQLVVAVQGCGQVGSAVARALADRGANVFVADLDEVRASEIAAQTGATALPPEEISTVECDIFAPCAHGGSIDADTASSLRAWAVCGAANNILASRDAGDILRARGVIFVPDIVSSAGAVIEGVAANIMGGADPRPLLSAIGDTVTAVLDAAKHTGRPTSAVAEDLAIARLKAGESHLSGALSAG